MTFARRSATTPPRLQTRCAPVSTGSQLQAGFNYLISQFLNPRTNVRTDGYGGSIENRARLLFDVLDAVGERIDIGRVGSQGRASLGLNVVSSSPPLTPWPPASTWSTDSTTTRWRTGC